MSAAMQRHNAIMKSAVAAGGGNIFKTVGEAFCAVFPSPVGAVQAALQAQLEMANGVNDESSSIRMRMAIHTGEAEVRDSDYFGPPLNRVARILTLGYGGQTLISKHTFDLVSGNLPQAVTVRDMGEHRLKDLQRPEHLFQLQHAQLQDSFKPLRSLDNLLNNLPQQATNFIGRERELADIKELLANSRILTLTGAGGTGKTRLGLQAAVELVDSSSDGTWLVEFGSVADPTLVPRTVASTIGVSEEPLRTLSETLVSYLTTKRMLLMLDNAEHLRDAIASLVEGILQQCPGVQALITSREPLGVSGETTYRVPSLSMPDPTKQYARESLSQFESVRLFVDRAVLALPTFELSPQNSTAVAQLCHRLDGIPLAIELAAARVRALQVERIAERLDDRFRLLTGGSRAALPRQQTLRAMIDWSYDLLSETERTMLRRLSVFSGGWTVDSAKVVCVGYPVETLEVRDVIQSLVDKSLAVHDPATGRFRLSETVRAYGRDALVEHNESVGMRSLHLDYFAATAESAEDLLASSEAVETLAKLDADQKNFRAAMEWGLEGGDSLLALRLANALSNFFKVRGEFTEGSTIYQSLAERVPREAKYERACALAAQGVLRFCLSMYSLAQANLEECLALFTELGDNYGAAKTVNTMGGIALHLGNDDEAERCFERALELFRVVGESRRIAMTLNNLGILAVHRDDLARARALYNEALELNQRVGNKNFEAGNKTNLADLAIREGDAETARRLALDACKMHIELGDRHNLQDTLEVLAPAELRLGRPRLAALLIATKEVLMEQLGTNVAPYILEEYRRNVDAVRMVLGDQEFEAIIAKGRLMSLEEVYQVALDPAPEQPPLKA